MLPARRLSHYVVSAELLLTALLGASPAVAQTSVPVAPLAAAPTSTSATAPASAGVAPAATSSLLIPPASLRGGTLPAAPAGHRADLASTAIEVDSPDTALRDKPLRKPPESARWLLLGAGLGTTALWYGGALGIRELWPSHSDRTELQIPVAGPFLDLAHTGCPASNPGCSTFQLVVRTILVTFDALGQAGGVALMLQGAVLGTASVEAPRSNPSARLGRQQQAATIVPVPWVDANGGGVGLTGRF